MYEYPLPNHPYYKLRKHTGKVNLFSSTHVGDEPTPPAPPVSLQSYSLCITIINKVSILSTVNNDCNYKYDNCTQRENIQKKLWQKMRKATSVLTNLAKGCTVMSPLKSAPYCGGVLDWSPSNTWSLGSPWVCPQTGSISSAIFDLLCASVCSTYRQSAYYTTTTHT